MVSGAMYSLGHGGNDAQKTMGIITVLLFSTGHLRGEFHVPLWVVLSCQAAMALGTLFGGWRIVHTMGPKITKLNPMQGFCAETGGAVTLFAATAAGIPVSTTHTVTGAIMGVGASRREMRRRPFHRRRLGRHPPGIRSRRRPGLPGRRVGVLTGHLSHAARPRYDEPRNDIPAYMTEPTSSFDRLASVLFDGPSPVADIKVVPGTGPDATREELSEALLASMTRVGIVRDGKLRTPGLPCPTPASTSI